MSEIFKCSQVDEDYLEVDNVNRDGEITIRSYEMDRDENEYIISTVILTKKEAMALGEHLMAKALLEN